MAKACEVNRRTAMPMAARRPAIRRAAVRSLEHVKQCAKSAVARWGPCGMSRRAANVSPAWPANVSFSVGMGVTFLCWSSILCAKTWAGGVSRTMRKVARSRQGERCYGGENPVDCPARLCGCLVSGGFPWLCRAGASRLGHAVTCAPCAGIVV